MSLFLSLSLSLSGREQLLEGGVRALTEQLAGEMKNSVHPGHFLSFPLFLLLSFSLSIIFTHSYKSHLMIMYYFMTL